MGQPVMIAMVLFLDIVGIKFQVQMLMWITMNRLLFHLMHLLTMCAQFSLQVFDDEFNYSTIDYITVTVGTVSIYDFNTQKNKVNIV